MKEGMSAALSRVYPRTWIETIEESGGGKKDWLLDGKRISFPPLPHAMPACRTPQAAGWREEIEEGRPRTKYANRLRLRIYIG